MVTFEALGLRGEQDPWAFYYCGKNNYCLITSDKSFLDHFTHMAAIQLGKTRIFAFTSGNENMHLRGKAFVKAQAKIFRVIKHHEAPFVASVGLAADVNIVDEKPMPTKKLCRPEHWESYLKVCKAEGVEIHEQAYFVAGSTYLRGSSKRHTEGPTGAKEKREEEGKATSTEEEKSQEGVYAMSKQYSFVIRDRNTKSVVIEGGWFNNAVARDTVARQHTLDGVHVVELLEKEINKPGQDKPGEFSGPA